MGLNEQNKHWGEFNKLEKHDFLDYMSLSNHQTCSDRNLKIQETVRYATHSAARVF